MKKTYDSIDYEWITRPTGDPFVDAGGYALEVFSNLFPDDDILELIMRATDIYVDRWNAKINAFFLNSKITQPSFKGNAKKIETEKYFKSLINNIGGHIGYCRVTGKRTYVFPAGRDNSVLSGSGTFINFNHGFESGLMVSKEVLIRYFFLPFACMQLQGKIALISSNSLEISKYFSQEICKDNFVAIANNSSDGIKKAKSYNPVTSLFRYTDMIITKSKLEFDDNNDDSLTLYHFTNLGQKPTLDIYQLPFQTLRFYAFTQKGKYRDSWNAFVNTYYYAKDYSYEDGKYYVTTGKKNLKKTEIDKSTYTNWGNRVYDDLVADRSLTHKFFVYEKEHQLDFNIIKTYEIKVRNMRKETVEKIEQMADFIMSSNDTDGVSKAIKKLYGISSSSLLRRFVIKDIVAKNYEDGNKDAIVSVNDYVKYLFPDTESWKETRDLLLIAIFERLHKDHEKILILDEDGEDDSSINN